MSESPLAATLARASRLEYADATLGAPGDGDGDGWIDPDNPATLARAITELGRSIGTNDRRVLGSFVLGAYTWWLTTPAIAAYLAERRIPDVAPRAASVRLAPDCETGTLAVHSDRFAALATDRAAASLEVLTVDAADALLGVLGTALEQHIAAVVGGLDELTSLRPRVRWAIAADMLASSFLWTGRALGREEEAIAAARQLVASLAATHRVRTGFVTLEHAGRTGTFVERGSCCFAYRLDAHEPCSTCTRLTAAERERRLRQSLEEEEDPWE